MSHEFLRSSPARDDSSSDSKSNRASSIVKTPATNKVTSTPFHKSLAQSAKKIHASQSQQQQQQAPSLTIPPSASKLTNQLSSLTGWTPLISKTYSNEQIISFNSTPNKLFISSALSQAQIQPQLLNQPQPPQPPQQQSQQSQQSVPPSANTSTNFAPNYNANDYEYQNFGLTPFISHNFNFNFLSGSNQVNSVTPFNEKIFQQNCEFFIDSPIRSNKDGADAYNTSLNFENFSITPSRFNLNTVASNRKVLQDPLKSATKRSINMVDTPPRVPHKLSIITRAENEDNEKEVIKKEASAPDDDKDTEDESDSDDEDEAQLQAKSPTITSRVKKELIKDGKKENDDIDSENSVLLPQTPCKKSSQDVSNQPKLSFNTPTNKQTRPESPSTILVASTERLSKISLDAGLDNKAMAKLDEREDDEDDKENQPPPSPTPAKISNQPKMGVFSEAKPKKVMAKPKHISRSSMDTTTTTTSFKSGCTFTTTSSGKTLDAGKAKDPKKSRAENKARMQAGMNKFQIVLTDVNSISGKKKKSNSCNNGVVVKKDSKSKPSIKMEPTQSVPIPLQPPQLHPQSSSIMDNHNVTISSSKEHNNSSILSHNSMNSSHLNLTTDHSSFEIGGHGSGGYSSTPNSKMLLDKIFEKPSPNQSLFFAPQASQPQNVQQQGLHVSYQQPMPMPPPPPLPSGQTENSSVLGSKMHPPPTTATAVSQQHQQQPSASSTQTNRGPTFVQYPVMSMMSTPQHSHIYNVGDLMPNGQATGSQAPMSTSSSSAGNFMQIPSPWNFTFGTPSGFSTIFSNLPFGQTTTTATTGNGGGAGAANSSSSSASNTAAAIAAVAAASSSETRDNYS
ncbi:hypothetical protein CANMA_001479 [Candida margitis]|uniref:uncharacterized protein n=1 Tax=Candida margitis TaxID=1775924 RepID=UPI0022274907|nr:uncharacterized protein CANMA_001479 [Candida margitis]KAI5969412.1 hypothetical protein CANMA_001479 [Candida margitis]